MGPLTFLNNSLSEPSAQPTFLVKRCLRSRLNSNQCQKCVQSCPTGAMTVIGAKIHCNASQCTGCMSCVAVCPQDALVGDHDIEELLVSLRAGKDVVISCMRQKQSCSDEITIPCVGIVSKQLLTAFVLSGCRSITFRLSGCNGCCNEDVSKAFRIECKQLLEALEDLRPSAVMLSEKKEQLVHHEMDRRSYLKKLREIAVGISQDTFPFTSDHLGDGLKKSRRIPFKTELIRKIVTNLDRDSRTKIIHLFSSTISLTEECNCCPLCKGICPTGAIKIEGSGKGKRLKFEMLDCSGCGLCVEFCKINAISMSHL